MEQKNCINSNIESSEITGTHNSEHNCLEDIIATYADWNKRDYRVMYLDSWNFGYLKKECTLREKIDEFLSSNRLLNVRSRVQMELLRMYAGINIQWRKCSNPKKELEWIYLNAKRYSIAIHIDVYWCQWTPMYQKAHCDHYCLVTDVTPTHLICLDPYNGNKQYPLSLTDFLSGVRGVVTLECIPIYEEPNLSKLIFESVNRVKYDKDGKSDFEAMADFIEEIFMYDRLKEYIESDKDVYTSALIRRLTQIANGRKKFSRLLKSILNEDGYKHMENYSIQFDDIAKKWEYIRNITLKLYLGGCKKDDVTQIIDRLKLVIEEEAILWDKLSEYGANKKN